MAAYIEHHCETIDQLLEYLTGDPPYNHRFDRSRGQLQYGWVYRGQAVAKWDLTPSALRPESDANPPVPRCGAEHRQMSSEIDDVRRFTDLADRVGLEIPDYCTRRDRGLLHLPYGQWPSPDPEASQVWPPFEVLDLFALAQHHGVPTRLLDVTFNPWVAIYFAIEGWTRLFDRCEDFATREQFEKDHPSAAVWCFRFENWGDRIRLGKSSIRRIEVDRAPNSFLQAQKGAFLVDELLSSYPATDPSPPIDKLAREDDREDWVVMKCTLAHQAFDVARHRAFAIAHCDRAHLMPSFDVCAQESQSWSAYRHDGWSF